MTPGDVVTWHRYSGDVFARVLSATKRVTVPRGEVVVQQETGR